MRRFFTKHKNKTFVCLILICVFAFFFILPRVFSVHYVSLAEMPLFANPTDATPKEEVFVPSYVSTPEPVKGLYITSWTASDHGLRGALVKLIDDTELNTIVIDIKDYSGKIVFSLDDNPTLKAFGSEEVRIKDLQGFIEELHKKGIYVVGRIAVFQDAYFVKYRPDLAVKNKTGSAVWKDRKGISWIDPGSREYWDYIILLAKEGRRIGFDEINFDYIRFPSDGDMQNISYPFSSSTPKHIVIRNFFEYLRDNLVTQPQPVQGSTLNKEIQGGTLYSGDRLKISADMFGMVTTAQDDMGIGQVLEDALPYFDYVMPMVYPSHYPATFQGFKDPEAHPYEVVKFALQGGINRANMASTTPNKIRPWLQDFGLKMTYGSAEVRAQIKATNDVGLTSWILWSASNKYTRSALEQNPQN